MMANVVETMLQTCPAKTVVRPSSIELWIKRPGEEWTRVIGIKAAKNNPLAPWSIRYYEFGVAKYGKLPDWTAVKKEVAKHYLVDIPDDMGEKLLAKITMVKMSNFHT